MMTTSKVRGLAKSEVKAHEQRMHGAKKMAKGGPTTDMYKKYGRNVARAMNQGKVGK